MDAQRNGSHSAQRRNAGAGLWRVIVPCAAALIALAGCTQGADESPVLVIVNGKPVTQNEFEYRWSELPASVQARDKNEGGRRKFLDDLISRELLLQEARKLGLDRTPRATERLERVKEQLALDELMKASVTGQVGISREELEGYYALHQAELHAADQMRAAHILVRSEEQARDLKRQLDLGADFAKLALRFSLDQTTKYKGGDLGAYRPGWVEPAVDTALLALKPGMVSEPVETASGFHLVKLIGREPESAAEVAAVRDRLRQELYQELYAEKQRQQFEALLAKLRGAA
ncbi:MAG: peptidylprolyl isomerase, partial [Nitrospiraceae bacterium]